MARLGDLERSVMDVLWDSDGWLTAREVAARLHHERDLAYTTVLTVLERLERKGFVQRQRAARAHRYLAVDAREAVVAEAMLEALGTADDRSSALVRFVGAVTAEEAEILRRALAQPAETDFTGADDPPADEAAALLVEAAATERVLPGTGEVPSVAEPSDTASSATGFTEGPEPN